MKKERIVITGGSGFIGSNLISALLERESFDIVAIDHKKFNNEKIKTFVGNFYDKEFISEIINKDDILIHLACTTVTHTAENNRQKDIQDNIVGTINLLDVCVEKKIKKIIFASSGGTVYGEIDYDRPSKETDCIRPVSAYGIMKATIENYMRLYNKLYNLPYIIVRISNPYPRLQFSKSKPGAVDIFLDSFINGKEINVFGDGKSERDYIFIDDLINFIISITEKRILNETFNAGSGKSTSIESLLKIVESVTGKKTKINYIKSKNFEVEKVSLDISKAKKELGWQPEYTIEKGVMRAFSQLMEQKNGV